MAGQLAIEYVAVASLKAAPYNPRVMPDEQMARLRQGIERFGLVDPVIVNQTTGNIVGGHQRVEAARQMGITEVPVVYVTLNRAEEKALNIALNKIHGEWDFDKLKDLLGELREDGFDLELTGFTEDEWSGLLADDGSWGEGGGTSEPDDVPEVDEETPPTTQPGDLILLGRHRLLCGDATVAADVTKVLDGATPALMVTDPPYGVEYDPAWRDEAAAKGLIAGAASRTGTVANDDRADWREAWALFPGAVVYCWHADRRAGEVQASLEAVGFEVRSQIIWGKPRFAISRGHYHWQHEPCWYAVRKGATASWCGDRSQTTLWAIPLLDDEDQKAHGTQKPTECMERPLRNHEGDVYEPFAGSGTTVIAAERQGRTCYAIEIDPRYCDVIVARWERFTGQKAQRPEQGAPSGRK